MQSPSFDPGHLCYTMLEVFGQSWTGLRKVSRYEREVIFVKHSDFTVGVIMYAFVLAVYPQCKSS